MTRPKTSETVAPAAEADGGAGGPAAGVAKDAATGAAAADPRAATRTPAGPGAAPDATSCCAPRRTAAPTQGDTAPSASHERDDLERLILVAKALSDPARLRMLDLMVQGRRCCELPDPATRGVPGRTDPSGICVCEFQSELGLGQSTTSYHLRVLREAGLVREEARGKWTFYELDRGTAAEALERLRGLLRL